ncbi:MAG TPA: PilW family protein [Burkholderiaceae bacterium]|nr:PilW family protein [Burkholderiaceae bacterium]
MNNRQATILTMPSNSKRTGTQKGFSLIELMVAMAMSLALLIVVVNGFVGMTSASRLSTVQQQMNEDAQSVFQILGTQIRMAGFNPVQARSSVTIEPLRNTLSVSAIPATETALGIFGCQTGFANAVTQLPGTVAAPEIWQLTCNAAASMPSLAVHYEADQFSPNISGALNTPSDCRGFAVPARSQILTDTANPAVVVPAAPYYLVENRYFIANGGLSCTGNGGVTPFETPTQPLVANIESIQIDYGVRAPQPFATVPAATGASPWTQAQTDQNTANEAAASVTAGYLTANAIGPASGNNLTGVDAGFQSANALAVTPNLIYGSQRWNLVNTVRVCIVVRSDKVVLTDELAKDANNAPITGYYHGCNPTSNAPIAITDGVYRKAYTMHFVIRSRLKTPS